MSLTQLTVFGAGVLVVGVAAVAVGCTGTNSANATTPDEEKTTFVGRAYDESGTLRDPAALPRVARTNAEWKTRLTPEQYNILRKHGTERAFTGELLENTSEGVYRCAACDLPLFLSETKFKSGTGWPSFFRAISEGNVGETVDRSYGMVRTEIHCGRCGGHLGHVFPDGPPPTGQRYCVNSLSLAFTPIEDVATLAEPAVMIEQPEPASDELAAAAGGERAEAVFAGGCFWCVEAVFEELDGVEEAVSGYAGGSAETANYKAVSSRGTGHAEAVKIVYDPSKVAYEDLLRVHFATHDPTTLNRQGADVGPQYRSAIFFSDEREKALAEAFIADLNDEVYGGKVVTTLEPLTEFYPAEIYHQNYVCENPTQGYVRQVALPKVRKVRKQFKDMLKDESPLDAPDH